MTSGDKTGERDTLILQLGMVLAPIKELAEKSPPPTSAEFRIAAATLQNDYVPWATEVERFTNIGGVWYQNEFLDITNPIRRGLRREIRRLADAALLDDATRQTQLRASLQESQEQTLNAINQVPISSQPQFLEAHSEFRAYLKIHDAIGTAVHRIHYFDRYVNEEFFRLYLRDLDRSLEVRLVTTKGNQDFGVDNVLPVSILVAQEFSNYQLIECHQTNLHDRNLRIDDSIFHLGASIKDAGRHPLNFTIADNSAQSHQILDNLISSGSVVS